MEQILVKRQGANGDVLIAASIVPALKKKHPLSTVYFETQCPNVLIGNPSIDFIVPRRPDLDFDAVFDLDMAYENRPNDNILKCYADVAGVPVGWCIPCIARASVNKPLLTRYVVVHAGKTNWAGRNWDEAKWRDIAMRFHHAEYQIICVGRKPDTFVPSDVDCRDRTTVHELATIIEDARLFVGIDSLPFHVAQVVGTPCVTFFGSIRPELRTFSPRVRHVTAKGLPCLGCHHRQDAPAVTLSACPLGTLDCETTVSADDMWREISSELTPG
jgi:ADP-heptose:LPS heptosyltransferase